MASRPRCLQKILIVFDLQEPRCLEALFLCLQVCRHHLVAGLKLLQPYAPRFVLIFVFGGLKHLRNFKETVDINKMFGIPLPTISAAVAILLLLSGSGFFLTGIPVFMEIGAELLLAFLARSSS